METEVNNELNFLDLTITKQHNNLKFGIYRKPTTTDVTIHGDSHHPYSQKLAAYNSLVHRLLSVPLEDNDFNDELNTIKHIAAANGYDCRMVDNICLLYTSFI